MTDMTREEKIAAIEGVLFAMGGAVEASQLMGALEIGEPEFYELMSELETRFQDNASGLQIIRLEDAYQMCTKPALFDVLVKVAAEPVKPKLTEVCLEVLSIIAYKQPVTRTEIERIRGVSSDYAVNRLVEYGLVEEAGRLDAPGRPILFRTTETFLRLFGLSSSEELPEIGENQIEEATEMAYEAAGIPREENAAEDTEAFTAVDETFADHTEAEEEETE